MGIRHRLARRLRVSAHGIASIIRFRLGGNSSARKNVHRALKTMGGGIGYGAVVEPSMIETTQTDIVIPGLPAALDGYRIAHLTDIHYNFTAGKNFLRRVVEKTNALDPDLVALTGDFIAKKPANMHRCMALLSDLRAPDGLWATRGNHDYKATLEMMQEACRDAGIRLLENQHAIVRPTRRHYVNKPGDPDHGEADGLVLAGVGDLWEGLCLPGRALEGAREMPTILLSHNPQVANLLVTGQRVDLILSGHTHGGQIRPMGRCFAVLSDGNTKYVSGLVCNDHTQVYISRGVGTSSLRFRWNCRPEIALLRLHRSSGSTAVPSV